MKYLIVSIDTEEDMPNWIPQRITTVRNILALPRLQGVLNKHHITATYLVDQPVLEDNQSVIFFRNLVKNERCELGAHIHSWNTPPFTFDEKIGKASYLSECAKEVIFEKVINYNKLFIEKMGFAPVSYRGGRFGLNADILTVLSEYGYKVDSSIAPLMNFSADGGPDFRNFMLFPHWVQTTEGRLILELPVTIALVHPFRPSFKRLYFRIPKWTKIRGALHRLNLARLLWLRPTTFSLKEMQQLADYVMDILNVPVLNIMFHSSEVCAGCSPYNKTEKDVDIFLDRLEGILAYLVQERNVQSVGMEEFASFCAGDKGMRVFGKELPVREI
jgi:hypothetical protein